MKTKWKHPKEPETSRNRWRSLGELSQSDEFKSWLDSEFPQGSYEMEKDEVSRRNFVKLMGASVALAGLGVSCKRPVHKLVPYNEHVEWVIPGKALYYSTCKPRLGGLGCDPLVATTYEGRPTKVDGNKLHPRMSGGSSSYTQASILDLYDQDRSRNYLYRGKKVSSDYFNNNFLSKIREDGSLGSKGKRMSFLVSESTSPTRNRILSEIKKKYPNSKFYSYEALSQGGKKESDFDLYGQGVLSCVNFSSAKRVLSLDCDFLGSDLIGEDSSAEFSLARNPNKGEDCIRLYSVESSFSLTGGMSDHRYRIASSQVPIIAALIAKKIASITSNKELSDLSERFTKSVNLVPYNLRWIDECAIDLISKKGSSVVVLGSEYSKEDHFLVSSINKAIDAYRNLITLKNHNLLTFGSIDQLAKSIKTKEVDVLFVLNNGDLVFDAPYDIHISDILKNVPEVIQLSYFKNKTTEYSNWHIPTTHYLESWGDFNSLSGVYSVQQPMISPLFSGVSENVFLLSLLNEKASESLALSYVKETFKTISSKLPDQSDLWTKTLRDGYYKGNNLDDVQFRKDITLDYPAKIESDFPYHESLEVVLKPSSATYDGRFSNNGWLQEVADPITKLTWGNAALISNLTAKKFKVKDGDIVEISVDSKKIEIPVLIAPGQADFVITLNVGYYGNDANGTVNKGVGVNVYSFLSSASPYIIKGVSIKKLKKPNYKLALTSEHYSMEGRAIAREGTINMYKKDEDFAQHQGMDSHIPENISLYEGVDYKGGGKNQKNSGIKSMPGHEFKADPLHQWAMTVDLNSCIGCNACAIACQSENNIPIVGRDQVLKGREMNWIRMDRYFTTPKDYETVSERGGLVDYFSRKEKTKEIPGRRKVDDDHVEMIPQMVACQQCESAPCESVCPVNATVHTSDGLNAMTYNRCIGTRYCANNCPYKARRFNYYDYNKRPVDKIALGPLAKASGNATTTQRFQKNPNVTVRMRGVIEKCTYCVQRISNAKIKAKVSAKDSDKIQVPANSITVACQDACSMGAISFGNLKNPKDNINKMKNNPRNYDLLKYIGTRPRTSYLARIKNPNPSMPGAELVGTVTKKMH